MERAQLRAQTWGEIRRETTTDAQRTEFLAVVFD